MKYSPKTIPALILTGILAGLAGFLLTLLMHNIQHIAFGYGFLGDVSFREGVEYASPLRRLLVLSSCGLLAGIGWFCIHRFGAPLISIKKAVTDPESRIPVWTTLSHGLLQIITVALGSPLGREVAPREISAAGATRITRLLHIEDAETRRLLIACASGAGLAAVYNVPLAAAVFVLETLLLDWSAAALGAALLCCGTAVFVVRLGLGDLIQYPLPQPGINEPLILWALLAGPLLAAAVRLFEKSLQYIPELPRKSPKMILLALAAFTVIGLLSMYFPEILGNGKAGNQLSFTFSTGGRYGLALFLAKWAAVWLATLAGAYGGRITPSMMLGGMLGLISAIAWNLLFPMIPVGSAAFIGAAVFLGLAQKMPLTAAIFLLELTRFSPEYLFPICVCLAAALLTSRYLNAPASGKTA